MFCPTTPSHLQRHHHADQHLHCDNVTQVCCLQCIVRCCCSHGHRPCSGQRVWGFCRRPVRRTVRCMQNLKTAVRKKVNLSCLMQWHGNFAQLCLVHLPKQNSFVSYQQMLISSPCLHCANMTEVCCLQCLVRCCCSCGQRLCSRQLIWRLF